MSTKPRYSYGPLPSARHTRLIRLHASNTDNYPIACDLLEVNVDDKPIYQALSYTWNNEIPSEPLGIVSANGSSTTSFLVTTNCARALKLLSKRLKSGCIAEVGLWVDAICIDQSSNEEKSAQVSMMAEIYRNATEVLVWLGNEHAPPNRRSMMLLPLLEQYNEVAKPMRFQNWPRWEKMFFSTLPIVVKVVQRASTKSSPMLNAPYWTRVWTLQEFAHVNARILCLNSKIFPCDGIGVANYYFEGFGIHSPHSQLRSLATCGNEALRTAPRMLSIFLPACLNTECSNPQDRVYALRDLFPKVFGAITVDYSRSVEDLFVEATRLLILSCQDVEALYTACNCKQRYTNDGPINETYDLPSWVVDWTTGSDGLFLASDGIFREEENWYWSSSRLGGLTDNPGLPPSFSDDGLRLKLWGKQFSHVSNCISKQLMYHVEPQACAEHFVNVVTGFFSEATETTFAKTETFGSSMARILRAVYAGWSETFYDALAKVEVERDLQKVCELLKAEWSTIDLVLRRRRFFVTTDGRLAIGNPDICPGDLICSFVGLTLPFVVRPREAYHVLISPAIIDGATEKEMWLDKEELAFPCEII